MPELAPLYRRMVLLRRVEETVSRLFNEGHIFGTVHLGIGQEAVATGICDVLDHRDNLSATYRGHGWALAKGMDLVGFFAELMGRETGICRGRGGSMHLCDMGVGFLGASGIVGGGLPLAVGSAYTAQLLGTSSVSVAVFGDGATNIGTFHESLNLAAVWHLPVIFCCENNLYGEFTPVGQTCLVEPLADRAKAYGIPGHTVDGNDVEAVRALADDLVGQTRRGGGPVLVEALTYRHRGHSRNDAARYRPKEEVDAWLARDPLLVVRTRLAEVAGWGDADERSLRQSVEAEIEAAVAEAMRAPLPAPAAIEEGVYANT